MADHSFDITSKIDDQEIDNAINQAIKETTNRYDLKDSNSSIEFNRSEHKIKASSSDDFKLKAVLEILKQKLIKRNISAKALIIHDIQKASGDSARVDIDIQQGIPQEKGKEIVKDIKASKIKVQCQIQGTQVRITAKKIDDLQSVIKLIKSKSYDIHIQFDNMR
ncbi:MAG: YajQ family cyclic di-GMP-binding protein [bacterium]|nr:YajQ family cyclic di-GMP-binding protein [bacterium]